MPTNVFGPTTWDEYSQSCDSALRGSNALDYAMKRIPSGPERDKLREEIESIRVRINVAVLATVPQSERV